MADKVVHINQVGYRRGAAKLAALNRVESEFTLIDGAIEPRLHGHTGPGVEGDRASGDTVHWADFTALDAGTYRLAMPEYLYSAPIHVADRPYRELKRALLKGLYYFRCGTALEEEFAGPWAHAICHEEPAVLYEDRGRSIDISGGWHDAGDYGKYINPAAVTVAMLLLTFEHIGSACQDQTGIPESGNGVPDILNEARWELDWMLKMQREDGAVWHKTTSWSFADFVMPEHDHKQWVVCPVSATATGDFAAALAMASRVYRPFDAAYADKLLEAARRAWVWLVARNELEPFHNPEEVSTGEYGDHDPRDEKLWAAVSLWRATGEEMFCAAALEMLERWPDVDLVTFGWTAVGGFAAAEVLFAPNAPHSLREPFRHAFLMEAERLAALAATDGYRVPMAPEDYIWGSTMVLLNRAVHLLLAGKLMGDGGFEQEAEDCLHWLLGRNPLGVCYVTGFGVYPVMRPHYRPSEADGVNAPPSGLVSGGPNQGRQESAARLLLPEGTPPARCFADDSGSYSTNEVTIYWNAPAVFVASWFDGK